MANVARKDLTMYHHQSNAHKRAYRLLPMRMSLVIWSMAGLVGCASAVSGPADEQAANASSPRAAISSGDRTAEAVVLSKINAAIGEAPCQNDDQCRIIGLGATACGGPAAWRPWSTQTNGQGETLKALTEEYARLQRQRQSQDGMVSTCRYIQNPGAQCQAQRCVLKKASDSAS